ncbi:hypothetical protein GCM10017653_08310 [Ancylobacter defluvii]|uniref:Uncharacterized protein n=1 Tax=Ancylobacter defluvii TaxID=1282440 RepID=A0A9W6JT33_9HYPH|nr:hypothetical protein GCM10017653_08310 [Ancylobacter defluvii]
MGSNSLLIKAKLPKVSETTDSQVEIGQEVRFETVVDITPSCSWYRGGSPRVASLIAGIRRAGEPNS